MKALEPLATTAVDLLEGLALASAIACTLYVLSLIARIERTGPDRERQEAADHAKQELEQVDSSAVRG